CVKRSPVADWHKCANRCHDAKARNATTGVRTPGGQPTLRFSNVTPMPARTRANTMIPHSPIVGTAVTATGAAPCVNTNCAPLSPKNVSATMNVIVGFATEKLGKPSPASVVLGSARLAGGVALPRPFAAVVGYT